MAAKNLTIGENYLSEIDLIDSDGNSIDRADIENLSVKIWQYPQRVIETIAWGSAKLTDGSTDSKLKIQVAAATSLKFREGKVYARVVSGDTDAAYTVDGDRISLPDFHILTAYIKRPDDEQGEVTEVIEHYRGLYDASVNAAPSSNGAGTAGAILGGDNWIVNVAGVIFGIQVNIGNQLIARINNPGQTSGNWTIIGNQS